MGPTPSRPGAKPGRTHRTRRPGAGRLLYRPFRGWLFWRVSARQSLHGGFVFCVSPLAGMVLGALLPGAVCGFALGWGASTYPYGGMLGPNSNSASVEAKTNPPTRRGNHADPIQVNVGPGRRFRNFLLPLHPGVACLAVTFFSPRWSFDVVPLRFYSMGVFSGGFVCLGFAPARFGDRVKIDPRPKLAKKKGIPNNFFRYLRP